jgi:hypothetical protein
VGDTRAIAVVDHDIAFKVAFADHPFILKKALNSAEMAESI